MTLDFDPVTHRYIADGHLVPSVTTIVAPLGEDYDEPDEFTEMAIDAAAERGTVLHAYIEHRLRGGEREAFELPPDYEDYADGVEQFLAEHEIVPWLVETPMTDGEFAGTPDLVCEFDELPAILDYKFVSSVSKSRVLGQLGGYLKLCEYNDVYPQELNAVQFMRGDYRLYPVNIVTAEQAWKECVAVYRRKTMKHKRGAIG